MMEILLTGGIFLLDYKVKEQVNDSCIQGSRKELLGGKLILRNCHNEGTLFGVLKPSKENCREISALALGGVIAEYLRQVLLGGRKLAKTGLAMVLGGALSNYADRRTKGYVTDYVSFGVENKKIGSMVFNISDFCIIGGSVLWLILGLLPAEKKTEEQK